MGSGFFQILPEAKPENKQIPLKLQCIIETIDMPFDDMRTTSFKITVAFSFEIDIQKNVILIHSTVT